MNVLISFKFYEQKRSDRCYVIISQRSLSTFEFASLDDRQVPVGDYHTYALQPYTQAVYGPPASS